MINKDTLLKDLFKNTKLEPFARYFYYGFDGDEWQNEPIGYHCEGLWGNDDTVKSLNNILSLANEDKVNVIYLSKDKKDVNAIHVTHNNHNKVAIVIAGGGYQSVATAIEGLPIGDYLYNKGFDIFYLTYSINKDAYNVSTIEDLHSLLTYLKEHEKELNIDLTNYIIGGCSAGAHLAGEIGSSNFGYKKYNLPKPGLIFLAYPVITMGEYAHLGSRKLVCGINPSDEIINAHSLEKNVDSLYPPTFMWQCDKDNIVPINNSKLMDEALNKNSIPHIYKTYDSDAHGWGLATGHLADHWVDEMLDFYKKVTK